MKMNFQSRSSTLFYTRSLFLVSALVFVSAVMAQGNDQQSTALRMGKVIKETKIVEQPVNQSDIVAVIKTDESIQIIKRQRAWYHISTTEQVNGWIKMLSVRFTGTAKREGEIGIGDFVSSMSNTTPTVSSGIRGFDEEQLKKAKANLAQVKLLNAYAATKLSAEQFAKLGKLKPQNIAIKEEQ